MIAVILAILVLKMCGDRDDLKIARNYLEDKNLELETKIHTLQQNEIKMSQKIGKYKDSIRHQDMKIQALENKKPVYKYVTVKEVQLLSDTTIAEKLTQARKDSANLELCLAQNRELKRKSIYQDEVINQQDSLIANLRKQNEVIQEQLAIKNEQITQYKKEVRRLVWQRNGSIAGAVLISIIAFL